MIKQVQNNTETCNILSFMVQSISVIVCHIKNDSFLVISVENGKNKKRPKGKKFIQEWTAQKEPI